MKSLLLTVACAGASVGCSAPYKPLGGGGFPSDVGYLAERLSADTYRIHYHAFMSANSGQLRSRLTRYAAELCRDPHSLREYTESVSSLTVIADGSGTTYRRVASALVTCTNIDVRVWDRASSEPF